MSQVHRLTLRTFHVGGIAGNISEENKLIAKFDGVAEIEDLKTVKSKDSEGKEVDVVISRTSELKLTDAKQVLYLVQIIFLMVRMFMLSQELRSRKIL